MRSIDADELMEHVWRDKLYSRELIAKMIDNAPTVIEEGCETMEDSLKASDIFNISAMSMNLKRAYEEMKGVKDAAFKTLELESIMIALSAHDDEINNAAENAIEYFKTYIFILETLVDSYFEYCDMFINKAEEEIFSEDT